MTGSPRWPATFADEIRTTPGTIYLNAASTGPLPQRALRAVAAFNAKRAAPETIGFEEQLGVLATARALAARLVNASPGEIALTPNTSTGLHLAAHALPLASGRVVLGHDAEFPANVYPWMVYARARGAVYHQLPLRNGRPDHEALVERVSRGDVGLVALSWVSFVSGDRADLARIGAVCRQHGTWLVVDAIQGVGAVPLDLARCEVDVLACGAQKWLCSPWGSGFTYIRRDLVATIAPATGGWLSMRGAEDFVGPLTYELAYVDDARKFEVATLPYQDFVGMNASLELFFALGLDRIQQHVHALATRLVEGIDAMPHLTLVTPREPARRAGIVSCTAARLETVTQRLAEAGVVCSVRAGGVLRFAPHFYNTPEEIERTLEVLDG